MITLTLHVSFPPSCSRMHLKGALIKAKYLTRRISISFAPGAASKAPGNLARQIQAVTKKAAAAPVERVCTFESPQLCL